MTATADDVTKKNKPEPSAEAQAAEELVREAREQGLSLTGPDGLLEQLTKTVLTEASGRSWVPAMPATAGLAGQGNCCLT
jgi:hypothetical protein